MQLAGHMRRELRARYEAGVRGLGKLMQGMDSLHRAVVQHGKQRPLIGVISALGAQASDCKKLLQSKPGCNVSGRA